MTRTSRRRENNSRVAASRVPNDIVVNLFGRNVVIYDRHYNETADYAPYDGLLNIGFYEDDACVLSDGTRLRKPTKYYCLEFPEIPRNTKVIIVQQRHAKAIAYELMSLISAGDFDNSIDVVYPNMDSGVRLADGHDYVKTAELIVYATVSPAINQVVTW